MTDWMLFLFVAALVGSVAASLAAFYSAMQILKIDANTSAVGVGGRNRSAHLREFILFAILAPGFALFAFGVALSLEKGWSMIGLSFAVALMQAIAAPYLGVNIVDPPAKAAENAAKLRAV